MVGVVVMVVVMVVVVVVTVVVSVVVIVVIVTNLVYHISQTFDLPELRKSWKLELREVVRKSLWLRPERGGGPPGGKK